MEDIMREMIENKDQLLSEEDSKLQEDMKDWQCQECGYRFNRKNPSTEMRCPKCNGVDIDVDTGKETKESKLIERAGDIEAAKFLVGTANPEHMFVEGLRNLKSSIEKGISSREWEPDALELLTNRLKEVESCLQKHSNLMKYENKINEIGDDIPPENPIGDDELPPEEEDLDVPEVPEEAATPDFDKLYLGRKDDMHYYVVVDKNDQGEIEDLKIDDQEGNKVYSAKEHEIDTTNVAQFILAAIDEIDIAQIERSVVLQYLVPPAKEEIEAEEEEDTEEELGLEEPEDVSKEEVPGEEKSKKEKPLESKKVQEYKTNMYTITWRNKREESNKGKGQKHVAGYYGRDENEARRRFQAKWRSGEILKVELEKADVEVEESKMKEKKDTVIYKDREWVPYTVWDPDRRKEILADLKKEGIEAIPDPENKGAGVLVHVSSREKAKGYFGESKIQTNEAKMGIDYMRSLKTAVRAASNALKVKDYEEAARALEDVADDAADAAKASKKMNRDAKAKDEKDTEEKESVDEKTAPTCFKCKKAHWPFEKCGGVEKDEDIKDVETSEKCGSKKMKKEKEVKEDTLSETTQVKDDKGNSFSVQIMDEGSDKEVTLQINKRDFHFQPDFAKLFGSDDSGKLTNEGVQELALETLKHLDDGEYAELIGSGKVEESKMNEDLLGGKEPTLENICRLVLQVWAGEEGVELEDVANICKSVLKKSGKDYAECITKESKLIIKNAVKEGKLQEGTVVKYKDKTAVITKITEANISLTVGDEAGASVSVNINGNTAVNIGNDGVVTVIPAPPEPPITASLTPEELAVPSEGELGHEEMETPEEEAAEQAVKPEEEEVEVAAGEEKLPFESKTNEKHEQNIYQIFPDMDETLSEDEEFSKGWNAEVKSLLKKHHCRTADEVPENELKNLMLKYDKKLKDRGEETFIVESKTNEARGEDVGFTKEVYEVEYEKDGKKTHTRVEALDEEEAKRMLSKKPGVKVLSAKKVSGGVCQEAKKESAKESQKILEEITIEDTEIDTWFERDRAHIELINKKANETIKEWNDEDVWEAVEDGFLDAKDWHKSAYQYAKDNGLLEGKFVKPDKKDDAFGGRKAVAMAERILGLSSEVTEDEEIKEGDVVQIVLKRDLKVIVEEATVRSINKEKGVEITGKASEAEQAWYGDDLYQVYKL